MAKQAHCLVNALTGHVSAGGAPCGFQGAGCPSPLRVGVLNLPQGVASHDAVRPNATGIQIRLRISRISSSSRKQLWVGRVFFRFGGVGDRPEVSLL